jgi:hypothetical protein
MTETEREKLIRQRKKELKEKEVEKDLLLKLKQESFNQKQKQIREENSNVYIDKAILFFGTVIPLYIFYFMLGYIFNFMFGPGVAMLGVDLRFFKPLAHGAIWVAGIISLYRDRSVLDEIVDRI